MVSTDERPGLVANVPMSQGGFQLVASAVSAGNDATSAADILLAVEMVR